MDLPQIQRRLQCYVDLIRKTHWVKRYAVLSKNFLFYKKKQSDQKHRRIINLYGCKIGRGKRSSGQNFIHVMKPSDQNFQDLKISFPDEKTFNAWLQAIFDVIQRYQSYGNARNSQKQIANHLSASQVSTGVNFSQYKSIPPPTPDYGLKKAAAAPSQENIALFNAINNNNFPVSDPREDIKYAEANYFSDMVSQARQNQILKRQINQFEYDIIRVDQYERNKYFIHDTCGNAVLYVMGQDQSKKSCIQHPPQLPIMKSKSVIGLIKTCKISFYGLISICKQ